MTTKQKRDYTARLTIYGLTKEVKVKTLVKWLRKQADSLEKNPSEYSQTIFIARLMK